MYARPDQGHHVRALGPGVDPSVGPERPGRTPRAGDM
jgi:hypothetical protein